MRTKMTNEKWLVVLLLVVLVVIACASCATAKPKYGCPDPNPPAGSKMKENYNYKRMGGGF